MSKIHPVLVAVAALPLALTACSGSEPGSAPTPSVTPSATPTTTPSTPSITPTPTQPSAPGPRTAAQLTKALLELKDLPSGFSVEPDEAAAEDDVKLSSKDARCARLVALMNTDNPPGSKASAGRSFSGGQDGPYIDVSLDAMGSTQAVTALQKSFKTAIGACRTITLTVPGEGSSPMQVREVSAPVAGQNPVAVRFTATGGGLEGFELTMVTTGVNDVVMALTFVGALPQEIDGATGGAVAKATKLLGGAKAGA
ncbi:hypothetical protein OG394_01075 [Kribbella sp. NBC_01245]|uniref:hypothetical protein n=1 Tax=Kribbella sp. NBC_01245 TaxID=2903578 RepID=UPI002E2D8873|nr:hypothetical protein [Kribbella sp. NBC_01245]